MEFRFNVNEVFKHPIIEINSSLIPPGLSLADKRALWDAVGKVSDVVNAMGEASATAQGLTKPITTSDRLRNSEHKLYLLIDQNANNGKGVVTGMLKTGKKGLYVFDRDGHHFQVQPACVLDFYVHESKQRMGLGKKLFEHMLEKEEVEPTKMAIDRPSDKLLGFLNKHYGLDNPVKQMNNFVVFDGFFPETKDDITENNNTPLGKSNQPANGLQSNYSSPYGRYGAPRPPCSMGQIIHNQSSLVQQTQEPAGTSLNIRAPIKTRSVYSGKNQTPSSGSQQSFQRAPSNTWNSLGNLQSQDPRQTQNNYNMKADKQQTPSNFPEMATQNQYLNYQNQQQPYNDLYNQANVQNSYNQNQYSPQPNIQQSPQPNPVNVYPNQQNLYDSNARGNNQQMLTPQPQQYMSDQIQNAQFMQRPPQANDIQPQQKKSVQFVPDQLNTQTLNYNQPVHSQHIYEQAHTQPIQVNQVTSIPNVSHQQLSQSSNQINVQTPFNVNSTQHTEPAYANNIAHPGDYQKQQNNIEFNPSEQQNFNQMQYSQQPIQNMQQHLNPQQTREITHRQQQPPQIAYQSQEQQAPQVAYQSQQPQQTSYRQPQHPTQALYQPQHSQGVYLPQQSHQPQHTTSQPHQVRPQSQQAPRAMNQTSQQMHHPQYSQQSLNQLQQPLQATYSPQQVSQVQQQYTPAGIAGEPQYDQNNNIQKQEVNAGNYHNYSDHNVNMQFQRNNNIPIQVQDPQGSVDQQQNYQNVQHPINYQASQQTTINQQQQIPAQNIVGYQQQIPSESAQNIQAPLQIRQSQQNILTPQQVYSQTLNQVDPSTIIPPAEAINNQMHKNYQYFDRNSGKMQGVTEKVKYVPGTGVGMLPNASGYASTMRRIKIRGIINTYSNIICTNVRDSKISLNCKSGVLLSEIDTEKAKSPEAEKTPETAVAAPPPKLERPQSLSLQTSEDVEGDEEFKAEIPPHVNTKSNFDIVKDIEKLAVSSDQQAISPSKTPDKGDGDTARKTPSHLTEQGFLDLKFYHNKLW